MWTILWVLKCWDWEKDFVHLEQEKGVSPVWVLWWLFRQLDLEKDLSQTGQGKSCSQVWDSWCDFKLEEQENNLLQIMQSKGFSSEWVRLWVFSWLELGKVLSHTWQSWSMVSSRLGTTGRHQPEVKDWYQQITNSGFGQNDLGNAGNTGCTKYVLYIIEDHTNFQ